VDFFNFKMPSEQIQQRSKDNQQQNEEMKRITFRSFEVQFHKEFELPRID